MKFRWFIGASALVVPLAAAVARDLQWTNTTIDSTFQPFPPRAIFNLCVAWFVGTLLGALTDSQRRQSFASRRHAILAAQKQLQEVDARIAAETKLTAAQARADAKSQLASQEKEALEARHSFVSMLCHEVRTPLSSCLAAAELLLETPLDVSFSTILYSSVQAAAYSFSLYSTTFKC